MPRQSINNRLSNREISDSEKKNKFRIQTQLDEANSHILHVTGQGASASEMLPVPKIKATSSSKVYTSDRSLGFAILADRIGPARRLLQGYQELVEVHGSIHIAEAGCTSLSYSPSHAC